MKGNASRSSKFLIYRNIDPCNVYVLRFLSIAVNIINILIGRINVDTYFGGGPGDRRLENTVK